MGRGERYGYGVATLISIVLVVGALSHRLEFDITEVLGFVSGALCVWLTVKENVWNFPISIANNIFFIVLFLQARLFADTGLQVVYIVLEILGWYWWLRGGHNRTALVVGRTTALTAGFLTVLGIACTVAMTVFLTSIADSAPFWDALTTVLSLIAQYMLTRKLLENWYVWMTADVIYVALYIYKGLYLTTVLYGVFFVMCIAGILHWRRSERAAHGLLKAPQPEANVA